jgi:hypothetical protein
MLKKFPCPTLHPFFEIKIADSKNKAASPSGIPDTTWAEALLFFHKTKNHRVQ